MHKNMTSEIEQIIKNQWNQLPEGVRSILANPELSLKIRTLGKNIGLTDEQLPTLETETFLVLLGLSNPRNFKQELQRRLGLPGESANVVSAEIVRNILSGLEIELEHIFRSVNVSGENENSMIVSDQLPENSSWYENIVFILSGGDFNAFDEV